MHLDAIALEDFRNFTRQETSFATGLNLVVGKNAQGKTNLLEGVYCLGGLGSPRASDAALVRSGAERALVHAQLVRRGRSIRIDVEIRPGRGSRALVNSTPIPSLRTLSETCTAVFFGPDELSLIKGSPDQRRRFLDDLVVKLHPAREPIRREWERVLRQRNALLKSLPRDPSGARAALTTLEVWDEALVTSGAALTAERLAALAELAPYAAKRYEGVAGGGGIVLDYSSEWLIYAPTLTERDVRDQLRAAVADQRERELERRMSLVGPQRDDVIVNLVSAGDPEGVSRDARVYGSQGDQRTCALALKLGEHDVVAEALGEEPILLLDDVFSELDPTRRKWLADAVRAVDQTILTSAEPGSVESAEATKVVSVAAGVLEEVRDDQQ